MGKGLVAEGGIHEELAEDGASTLLLAVGILLPAWIHDGDAADVCKEALGGY